MEARQLQQYLQQRNHIVNNLHKRTNHYVYGIVTERFNKAIQYILKLKHGSIILLASAGLVLVYYIPRIQEMIAIENQLPEELQTVNIIKGEIHGEIQRIENKMNKNSVSRILYKTVKLGTKITIAPFYILSKISYDLITGTLALAN